MRKAPELADDVAVPGGVVELGAAEAAKALGRADRKLAPRGGRHSPGRRCPRCARREARARPARPRRTSRSRIGSARGRSRGPWRHRRRPRLNRGRCCGETGRRERPGRCAPRATRPFTSQAVAAATGIKAPNVSRICRSVSSDCLNQISVLSWEIVGRLEIAEPEPVDVAENRGVHDPSVSRWAQ